jgi:hypothetical protein
MRGGEGEGLSAKVSRKRGEWRISGRRLKGFERHVPEAASRSPHASSGLGDEERKTEDERQKAKKGRKACS